MNPRSLFVALSTCLAVLVLSAAGAFADAAEQGGRHSSLTANTDGYRASVRGDAFNPMSGGCIIFAVLEWSPSAYRQVEAGLVRCQNASIDGTCNNVRFVERWTGPGGVAGQDYVCFPHGGFVNGTYYGFSVYRDSSTSNKFHAYLNGVAQEGAAGFANDAVGVAWGEHTHGGGSTCSGWHGNGYFYSLQKFNYGSGWAHTEGVVDTTCWYVTGVSGLEWIVDH